MPPLADPVEAERLSLHPLGRGAGDFALYRALYCDPQVMRHITEPVPDAQAAASFQASCRDSSSAPAFPSRWCVRRRADGQGIGLLGAFHDPAHASVELGIMLLPEAQARGLAHEALAAMMAGLHGRADVARYWSRHRPANRPMARVLERLGFVRGEDLDDHWRWQRPAADAPR